MDSFVMIVEDCRGREVEELEGAISTVAPSVGDEVSLEGVVYRVDRIRYEDDPERPTVRRHLTPRVFLRPVCD
jgi:hypothetical protein